MNRQAIKETFTAMVNLLIEQIVALLSLPQNVCLSTDHFQIVANSARSLTFREEMIIWDGYSQLITTRSTIEVTTYSKHM